MKKRTIVKLPGDGIGRTVLEESIRVLEAAGFDADYVEGDIGWEFWCNEGNPLPERTIQLIEKHKVALFGAITSKPKDEAFKTHPRFMKNFGSVPVEELSISTRIFTKKATSRILHAAFSHAKKYKYKSVTLCEKPNVIRETSGMMYKMALEIQHKEFPEIELWNTNIDAQMMWLTKNPENYGVIVAGNMFGDIVSDGFAGLIGGLGFACSAQVNPESGIGVFEPTHGSAPKYADYPVSIVNPIAMVESTCMMLDHIDEQKIATKIRKAVAEVISERKVQTYDMKKMTGQADVIEKGAASTTQMADAIIEELVNS